MFAILIFVLIVNYVDCIEFSFKDCGNSDKTLKFNNLTLDPHPVQYPGIFKLIVDMEVLKDIVSDNLKVKAKIEKIRPKKMRIPCLFGLGSCTLDLCEILKNHFLRISDRLSGDECPFRAGHMWMNNIEKRLPNFNALKFLNPLIEGDYSVNTTIFDSKTNQTFGCIQMNVTVERSMQKNEMSQDYSDGNSEDDSELSRFYSTLNPNDSNLEELDSILEEKYLKSLENNSSLEPNENQN